MKAYENLRETYKKKLDYSTSTLKLYYNTRGVNSRELFRFFGHNSLSYHAIWTKIGGNLPTDLPDLPKPSKHTKNLKKHKILESKFLKFLENLHDYLR